MVEKRSVVDECVLRKDYMMHSQRSVPTDAASILELCMACTTRRRNGDNHGLEIFCTFGRVEE